MSSAAVTSSDETRDGTTETTSDAAPRSGSRPVGGDERRRATRATVASVVGAALGGTGVASAAFAVFMQPLSEQYGWSRARLAVALTAMRWAGSLVAPFVGRVVDRRGARAVVLPLTIASSLVLMTIGLAGGSLAALYVLYGVLGALSPGIAPYSKTLSGWFDRRRGLALGAFGAGVFVCAGVVPPVSRALGDAVGWRGAYAVLGATVLVVSGGVLAACFHERDDGETRRVGRGGRAARVRDVPTTTRPGATPREAWTSGTYWLVVAALACAMFAYLALAAHDVSIFRERGLTAARATAMVSILAAGGLVAQLAVGYLLDAFDTPRVILPFATLALVGAFVVHHGHGEVALGTGAFLLGVGSGGETSMTSYYVTRYFGLRHFSQIYASVGPVITVTVGAAPVVVGAFFDRTGSYGSSLVVLEIVLAAAVILFACLGPYRYAAEHEPATNDG